MRWLTEAVKEHDDEIDEVKDGQRNEELVEGVAQLLAGEDKDWKAVGEQANARDGHLQRKFEIDKKGNLNK